MKYHVVGLKCGECGSYNTSRDDDGNAPFNPVFVGVGGGQNELEVAMEGNEFEELVDSDIHDDETESEDDEHVTENDENTHTDSSSTENEDGNSSVESDFSLD